MSILFTKKYFFHETTAFQYSPVQLEQARLVVYYVALRETYKFWISGFWKRKIRGLWKRSEWQNPDQERTSQDARIHLKTTLLFQSGRTYCAAFCASIALLTCSGNNVCCEGGIIVERLMKCARPSFGWFICAWASMKFFRHFTVEKRSFPCLLRGSLAYMFSGLLIIMQHVKRVCVKIVSS